MGQFNDQEDPLGILQKKQEDPLGILKKKEPSVGSMFGSMSKLGGTKVQSTQPSVESEGVLAGVKKTYHPEFKTEQPEIDQNDPIKSLVQPIRARLLEIKQKPAIDNTAAKPIHDAELVTEIDALRQKQFDLENYRFGHSNEAKEFLQSKVDKSRLRTKDGKPIDVADTNIDLDQFDEGSIWEAVPKDNETALKNALPQYLEMRGVKESLKGTTDLADAALKNAQGTTGRQVRALKGDVPQSMKGNILLQFLQSDGIKELAQEDEELAGKIQKEVSNFPKNYPEAAATLLANTIAQAREDMGVNDGILKRVWNPAISKKKSDFIINGLVSEGKLPAEFRDFYEKNRDIVNMKVKTTDFVNNFFEGLERGVGGVLKTATEATGVRPLLAGGKTNLLRKNLDKAYTQTSVKPKGFWSDVSTHGGLIAGQILPMAVGGNYLRAMKFMTTDRAANMMMAGIQSFGEEMERSRTNFPDSPVATQVGNAMVNTGIVVALANVFNDTKLARSLTQKASPRVAYVIKNFQANKISREAAKAEVNNIWRELVDIGKPFIRGAHKGAQLEAFEEGGTQVLQDVNNQVFGGEKKSVGNIASDAFEVYRTTLLGGIAPAIGSGRMAVMESPQMGNLLYEMAGDKKKYEDIIKGHAAINEDYAKGVGEKLENLDFIEKLRTELDKNESMPQWKKERIILAGLDEHSKNKTVEPEEVVEVVKDKVEKPVDPKEGLSEDEKIAYDAIDTEVKQDFLHDSFKSDVRGMLKEAAEQLNASPGEAETARKVYGDTISDIALKLHPKVKSPSTKEEQVSVEDKKADIEYNRGRELKPINDLAEGKRGALNISPTDRESTNIGEGFTTILENVKLTDAEWKEARREIFAKNTKAKTLKEHQEWRKDFEKRVSDRLKNEINEKYDSQLAELEKQTPEQVSVEDKVYYHSSRDNISLDAGNIKPIHFSDNREYAEQYGKGEAKSYSLKIEKPFDTSSDENARKIYNEEFLPYAKNKSNDDKKYEELGDGESVPFTTSDLLYVFLRSQKRGGVDYGYDAVVVDEKVENQKSIFPLSIEQIKEKQFPTEQKPKEEQVSVEDKPVLEDEYGEDVYWHGSDKNIEGQPRVGRSDSIIKTKMGGIPFKDLWDAFYVTNDKGWAEFFSPKRKRVHGVRLKKNAKILDLSGVAAESTHLKNKAFLGGQNIKSDFLFQKDFDDYAFDWLNKERVKNGKSPLTKEEFKNKDLENSFRPTHKNWFLDDLGAQAFADYAKERGYDAVKFGREIAILNPDVSKFVSEEKQSTEQKPKEEQVSVEDKKADIDTRIAEFDKKMEEAYAIEDAEASQKRVSELLKSEELKGIEEEMNRLYPMEETIETKKMQLSPEQLKEVEEYEGLKYKVVAMQPKEQGYKPYKLSKSEIKRLRELDEKYGYIYRRQQPLEQKPVEEQAVASGTPPIEPPPPTKEPSKIHAERPPIELSLGGLQKVANEFGYEDVKSRDRVNDTQERQNAINTANEWIEKGTYQKNINDLLTKIENKELIPTAPQRLILEQHLADEVGVAREIRTSKGVTSPEYDAQVKKIKHLKDVGAIARQEAGAALRIPAGGSMPKPVPDTLEEAMINKMDDNGTDTLTDKQKEDVEKLFTEYETKKKEFEDYVKKKEEEFAAREAAGEFKKYRATRNKTGKDYAAERKQAVEKAREALKKVAEQEKTTLSSDIPIVGAAVRRLVAIAPHVKTVVASYAAEGIDNLKDVIAKVIDEFKEFNLTDKEVNDIIAGRYNEKKPTRKEAAATLYNLQAEAKLIAKLDDLENGVVPKEEKKQRERNQKITDLREKIKKAQKDLPSNQLKSYKSGLESQISRLKEKIKNKDFEINKPKREIPLDDEAKKLKDDFIKVKKEYAIARLHDQYMNRSRMERARDAAIKAFNIPRTLMASMDYSAPLRQALIATASHPILAARAGAQMFKSSVSQKSFDRWFHDLQNDPRFEIMKQSGLAIADPDSPFLAAREEAFMDGYVEKVPGIGKLVKGSERAYTQFLNKMRVDLFNRFAEQMELQGRTIQNSERAYKEIASYVNNITGRGGMGKLDDYAPLLSGLFFSPRLIASRLNTLTYLFQPRFYKSVPPVVRKAYFKDLLSLVGLGMTVLQLAKMNGEDVEDDPRSTDFGKIKSGKTRWDIWGGYQQYIGDIVKIVTGERKSANTGKIYELDGDAAFGKDRSDVILNRFRGKLAPVPAMAVDMFAGRNIVGNKIKYDWDYSKDAESTDITRYLQDHLIPLNITGFTEALKDQDSRAWFTVGIPSTFGISVQTYDSPKPKPKSVF